MHESALVHIVGEQPFGERLTVPHVGLHVPGQAHRRQQQKQPGDLDARELQPITARQQHRAGHRNRQHQPRRALGQRGQGGKIPGRQVPEAFRAPLTPVEVDQVAKRGTEHQPTQQGLEHGVRRLSTAARLIAGHAAVPHARARKQLIQVPAKPIGRRGELQGHVARHQVAKLGQHRDQHHAEEQVKGGKLELATAQRKLQRRRQGFWIREQTEPERGECRGQSCDIGHVGHALMREQ
jgi:hypothetical protein